MGRTKEELVLELATERIDQILMGKRRAGQKLQGEKEMILNGLDKETRHTFEEFAGSLMSECVDDYILVYLEAFCDGLRLAHKAF